MEYSEAKEKFIQSWGALGTSWGINRAMAQIHALLLIATQPLSTEDIMQELNISRGNANMNIRSLIDWGIVEKKIMRGQRMEYFETDKDVLELARIVSRERLKREIEPVQKVLADLQRVQGSSNQVKVFREVTSDLSEFTQKLKRITDKFVQSDKNWFYKILVKLLK